MLLQNAIYLTFSFLALSTASPTPDESFLPPQRYSRDVVEQMKADQSHPPGHIYDYATFPVDPTHQISNETYQVPRVESHSTQSTSSSSGVGRS
ncbi:hypothetical protein BFJ68_g16677 [Fusarium oxysporum]|uniref:Uncharacterized protein n=2 Tax=Fusarium oxysporum TaxID=5507 RepID=A0A420PAP1_FUSOX|nr:hypothetical protein BFJ65_g18610 [Fusarium oxysporum f. sp. cepae]RKK21251.1 hypothetical protein BFJ67_g17383 [Fusarium oxysporum f. sp. cepae]RKK89584.1 hypothetical protein BFJ68_g16677 [Fusarium oxysporum]